MIWWLQGVSNCPKRLTLSTLERSTWSHSMMLSNHIASTDTVSEQLRRWTRNPLGSARRGSNPLGVVLPLLLLLVLLQTWLFAFAPQLPWAFAHHLFFSPAHGTESKRMSRGVWCVESAQNSEENTNLPPGCSSSWVGYSTPTKMWMRQARFAVQQRLCHAIPRGEHALLSLSTSRVHPKTNEAREIRTPNLLIWSQTRCRCVIPPLIFLRCKSTSNPSLSMGADPLAG